MEKKKKATRKGRKKKKLQDLFKIADEIEIILYLSVNCMVDPHTQCDRDWHTLVMLVSSFSASLL